MNQQPNIPHVSTYIFRGIRYAATSASAIFAGYLMQSSDVTLKDILILSIPIAPSVFFFICYANRFHSRDSYMMPGDEIRTVLQREALYIFPVFGLIHIIYILSTQAPPPKLVLAFAIYSGLLIYYGVFLLRHSHPGQLPLIRHQLVWPVILSIGVGLYYGLFFSRLSVSIIPLLPIATLVILYAASEAFNWPRALFVKRNLLFLLIVTIFVVLNFTGLLSLPAEVSEDFSIMLFCVSVASYLAVFEAWRITADLAQIVQNEVVVELNNQSTYSINKASQYSIATLAGLMGSVWILPFYFIFSTYGTFFLIGFAVHALIAFGFWYFFGTAKYFQTIPWVLLKTVAGLLFLVMLVAATFFNKQPSSHFMKGFVSLDALSILLAIDGYLIYQLYREFKRLFRRSRKFIFLRLFERRVNFIRVLSLLCWITCFVIVALVQFYEESSERYFKAELAFSVYSICIFLCFLAELFDSIWLQPSMSSFSFLLGILQTIRILTSSVIAMIVFLPAVSKGISIVEAMTSALPFLFAAMGGFALNDYFDYAKDEINKPHRAIPTKRLSRDVVLLIAVVLVILAISASLYKANTLVEFNLYALSILGVSSYNFFVKHLTLSKTFLTAAISALPILYNIIMLDYPKIYFLAPVASWAFLLGREWLMDITDIAGDKISGITTLPMVLGTRLTAKMGFIFQFIGGIVLLPLVLRIWPSWQIIPWSCVIISIFIMAMLWSYNSGAYRSRIILCAWLPMICGTLVLLD